jgi:fumarate hydratase class II
MDDYRIEKDSWGEIKIPSDVYWGAQTQRAIENFPISGMTLPPIFIHSLALIKHACASVNRELNLIEPHIADAIIRASEEIRDGKFKNQFPVDVFQTGSGTSTNMNVNELIAARANELITGNRASKSPVHPNDHVNKGQSSNDIIPTVIHVAASIQVKELLLPAMRVLEKSIKDKQLNYDTIVKTGRTHLMDAMPITLKQEMSGWATQIE